MKISSIVSLLSGLAHLALGAVIRRADQYAAMNGAPAVAGPNSRVYTDGLSSCITLAAIGQVGDTPAEHRKVMSHIGVMGRDDDVIEDAIDSFFNVLTDMEFRQGTVRVSVTHPSPTYVQTYMMNSAQFRADVEALGGIDPAGRLQRTLNNMAEEAMEDALRYYRFTAGVYIPWQRPDPLPLPLSTPGTHEIRADGSEYVDDRPIAGSYP